MHQDFCLQPFLKGQLLPTWVTQCSIQGSIARSSNFLSLNYILTGALESVEIPVKNSEEGDRPIRTDNLWEETCFEFFLAIKDARPYWEFNASPSGDWNGYRFTDYRNEMVTETAVPALPFSIEHTAEKLQLTLELDLTPLVSDLEIVTVGVSTVVKGRDGFTSYWALVHPGPSADFHRRDSFLIELPNPSKP